MFLLPVCIISRECVTQNILEEKKSYIIELFFCKTLVVDFSKFVPRSFVGIKNFIFIVLRERLVDW